MPSDIKRAAKAIAGQMHARHLFFKERKSRRTFASVIFLALKFSRKHKLLNSSMLDKIVSETQTAHKLLYEDYTVLKPFLSKLLPQFQF